MPGPVGQDRGRPRAPRARKLWASGMADRAGSTVGVRGAGRWNRVWSVVPRPTPLRKSPAGTVGVGAESLHPPPGSGPAKSSSGPSSVLPLQR